MIAGNLADVLAHVPFDRTYLLVRLDGGLCAVVDGNTEDWERVRNLVTPDRLIVSLGIHFRSASLVTVPQRAKGYFFRPAVAACLSGSSHSFNLFVVGHQEDSGLVRTKSVVVPELIVVSDDTRDPSDQESVGPSLITNW